MQGRTRRVALAAAFIAVLAAACGTDLNGLPTEWRFDNRTNGPVTIIWERQDGQRVELTTVAPGERGSVSVNQYGNPRYLCDDGEMVAIDRAGLELDRWPTTCGIVAIPVPTPG